MKRNLSQQQYKTARYKHKRKVKYESRSRHAKNRKRAKDGKFLPNDDNCSRAAMSESTILKETERGSRSRSRSRDRNMGDLLETDSIARGLSPSDLRRGESQRDREGNLTLARHESNISTDIFKSYENPEPFDEMLFNDKKSSSSKTRERQKSIETLDLPNWASMEKDRTPSELPSSEPKLFHEDSMKHDIK